jgi:transcriptional regulator with XRE-family HTH domain
MSAMPIGARLSAVEDDSAGGRIRARRKRLGMTIGALADHAKVDRDTLSAWERGVTDPHTSTAGKVERALDELEHELGMDLPSVVSQPVPVGDPDEGMVEFTVEGVYGVRSVVVKGPIRDIAELRRAVSDLIAGMDKPHPEG